MLGLRIVDGVDIDAAAAELAVPAWPEERARARERLVERGRLEQRGSRWVIPKGQWLLADGTISALM